MRIAVATSGGRDSTALLHVTVRAALALGVEVFALHVHHGLQAEADAWQQRVRQQAQRWGARFDLRQLSGKPSRGESVEAWARAGRYAALADMARAAQCDLVLLAHHRRDQAETWLLQALRSGSAAGLSSMPQSAVRSSIVWARPWLYQPREAIEAYVRRHRISFIDDPSNADVRFARNRLRAQVWPVLSQAFPAAEEALVGAALHAQRAQALSEEILAVDLPAVRREGALHVPSWLKLSPVRRLNVLDGWLAEVLARRPPASLSQRLFDELPRCRVARWASPAGELQVYRGLLTLQSASTLKSCEGRLADPAVADRLRNSNGPGLICLDRPGTYGLSEWSGAFQVSEGDATGASPQRLRAVRPQARVGGEQFRLSPQGTARSLKKQYQQCAVPPWARSGPLLYDASGQLVFVPGLGVEASARARPGEGGLHIVWVPVPT